MFGNLTPAAIESLLRAEIVGRIGYVDRRGLACIVPFTYAYDGRAFYGYSLLGAKIESMGVHPTVCVEVDRVASAADWCSVIARGTFEHLEGSAAVEAVERISHRLRMVGAATAAPVTAWRTFVARTGGDGIAYRIRVTEKHGRYSSSESEPST
jgi:nitroimidazol reductase NimA-like FMN-containing flavoprotein (pyridoxamine 5'-phosphate oxidase superfamily)